MGLHIVLQDPEGDLEFFGDLKSLHCRHTVCQTLRHPQREVPPDGDALRIPYEDHLNLWASLHQLSQAPGEEDLGTENRLNP